MQKPSIDIEFGFPLDPKNPCPAHLVKQPRKLIFDYNALAFMQQEAKRYDSDMAPMIAIRAALCAGLLAETIDRNGRATARTLSLIEVGDILAVMSKEDIDALVEAITQAREIAEPPKTDPTTATASPLA